MVEEITFWRNAGLQEKVTKDNTQANVQLKEERGIHIQLQPTIEKQKQVNAMQAAKPVKKKPKGLALNAIVGVTRPKVDVAPHDAWSGHNTTAAPTTTTTISNPRKF